ncbi:MAG: phosphate ABC transporter permease PstA [Pseudohongiellaceae bacterium]|jgi:phosphate transport system permease protein
MKQGFLNWLRGGTPWVWINAGAVAISIIMVVGLVLFLALRGMSHFWPRDVMQAIYQPPITAATGVTPAPRTEIIGEFVESEQVPVSQLLGAGLNVDPARTYYQRNLLKLGNRDLSGSDFTWVVADYLQEIRYPEGIVTLERREWGNFYGYLTTLLQQGRQVAASEDIAGVDESLWQEFLLRLERAQRLHEDIERIEDDEIGGINYAMERLRLEERRLRLEGEFSAAMSAGIDAERRVLEQRYEILQRELDVLYERSERDSARFVAANGQQIDIAMANIVRAYQPNALGVTGKVSVYFSKLREFLSTAPREANTEGGIFPAIFGTVMMVLLMSVFVTPFGVMAAVYLHEYARQGIMTRTIRIAVNNLAGVPSIVYGVFGLGFFIYIIGAGVDQLFYPEALPAPTFGTGGLLWASLTLALLTVPVVIVATEEGLARIPRSVREGSLALGATKFETLWRVVLPMASPAMITGLILAVARAAGEVAPLMLVGVVKLAPSLPLDGNYPYLHLDQKFMHLGFHIYDVGFQSPNVEAARPLVFATAFLLVCVIGILNLLAVALRNHLREKYRSLDVE